MKWYNQRAYKQHIEDLKYLDVADWRKKLCLEFVNSVANTFDRTYPRVGVLDINDLIQEGYISALTSWRTLKWDAIEEAPEDEQQAIIWNYIQLAIRHGIGNAIKKYRDGIRIPKAYFSSEWQYADGKTKTYQTDIFLTKTFASFFDENYAESLAYQGESYDNERLNEFLNDVMEEFLDTITMQIIKMFYGMDEPNDTRKPVKQIMEWARKSETNIKSIKHRGIKKLKQIEVTEQIEKYLLNVAAN